MPPGQLQWLLLADVERMVNKDGVHFGGLKFIAGPLNGLVGEKVQVRYTPHDLRQIEVFRGVAELHVWPGGYHLFELFAPQAALSTAARDTRTAWTRRTLRAP